MDLFFSYCYLIYHIPLWVVVILLIAATTICLRFRKRKHLALRNMCIIVTLAVGVPYIGANAFVVIAQQIWKPHTTGGERALEVHFSDSFDSNSVSLYHHQLQGIEDHVQYWKLTNIGISECTAVIQKHGLSLWKAEDSFNPLPFSIMDIQPDWWPRNVENYEVYRNSHSKELWIPEEGNYVLLYKFTE